jgi:L-ascorbate metabolism protein UlaG (beta-lactamase superfamily)
MRTVLLIPLIILSAGCTGFVTNYDYGTSTLQLDNISIIYLGHSSFMIEADGKTIYIDPYVLPVSPNKADFVFVSHDHFDHAGVEQEKAIRKEGTILYGATGAVRKFAYGNPVAPGVTIDGEINVDIVEAYTIDKFRDGVPYHPKGTGVGFIFNIDGKRIYFAGDTDFIPEMNSLGNIDVAILPIGGRFTMDVKEAALAARTIKPKILVPMHYNSDRYGIQGLHASVGDLMLELNGQNIVVNALEPLVK